MTNNRVHTTLLWGIDALLVTLPFGQSNLTNALLVALLLGSLVPSGIKNPIPAWKQPLLVLPWVMMAWFALSIAWGGNPAEGLKQLETKLALLIVPWIGYRISSSIDRERIQRWTQAWALGATAALLFILGRAAFSAAQAGQTYTTVPGTDVQISFFTYETLTAPLMHPGYLATHLGLAFWFVLLGPHRKWQKAGWLALLFAGLFLVQGRINLLALMGTLGLWAIAYAWQHQRVIWLALPAGSLVVIALLMAVGGKPLRDRYLQWPDLNYDITAGPEGFNSATYRLAEWTCAMEVIQQHLWWGTGAGGNRDALQNAYLERGFQVGYDRRYNTHNLYLEWWMAAGLVGLMTLLAYAIGLAVQLARSQPTLFWPWLFVLLCGATESMLERAWGVGIWAVYAGLLCWGSWAVRGATKSNA
jgi:O-antigen ligase